MLQFEYLALDFQRANCCISTSNQLIIKVRKFSKHSFSLCKSIVSCFEHRTLHNVAEVFWSRIKIWNPMIDFTTFSTTFSAFTSKFYIPSTINIWKRCSPKPFGQTKNGLVSGRLACTSSKTEMLNKIGI